MNSRRHPVIVWLLLISGFLAPLFCLGTYYIYLAELVAILSIAAIGLRQFVAFSNQLAFSQAAMMALGAYGTALLSTGLAPALPGPAGAVATLVLGILAGVAAATIIGAVIVYPALRLRGPYFSMVTIAFGWIVWRIAIEWVPVTGGDLGISAIPNFAMSVGLPQQAQYLLSIAVLALAIFITARVAGSAFGVLQAAHRSDPVALSALGVRAHLIKLLLFCLASAWGSVAGALFAMQQSYVNPNSFDIFDAVFLLIAVLIGGVRSSIGAIVGVAIIFILPEFLHVLGTYRLSFYAILVLVVLLLARNGLLADPRAEGWRQRGVRRSRAPPQEGTKLQPQAMMVEDISKCFGSLRALDCVSAKVEGGVVEGIIGPNGSGKSTLLDIVSGYVERDDGSVTLDGSELPRTGLDKVGRLQVLRTFQNSRNFDDLTCRENILVALAATRFRNRRTDLIRAIFGRMTAEDVGLIEPTLAEFGLKHEADTPAGKLSQGHKRLLEIARVVAAQPRVLLLDEPTSGLDDKEIAGVIHAVDRCKGRGVAVFVVDHNMDFISAVADQVTALSAGKVIACGTPAEVLANPAVIEAYSGSGTRSA